MNIFKEIVKKWYYYALLMFTLLVLAFSLTGYSVNSDNVMFASQLLQLFAFSVVASLCIATSDCVKNNNVIKQAVRFVLVYASFAVFFFALGAGRSFINNESGNKIFTVICMTLLFVGIYVVVAAVIFGFTAVKKAAANKKLEYKNQFDDVKNNTEN